MKKVERYLVAILGMTLINIGIVFVAKARIGSDCVTLLLQAFNNNFGFTLGTWNAIFGAVFVVIALICDKKKIGFATIYYVIAGKFIIDGLMNVLPDPNSYLVDAIYCLLAIIVISFGSALSISARLGLSYYDAFCYAVTDRFNIKYIYFRYVVEGIFIIISFFLHTYPGIGTIIYFIALGPCVTFILNRIKTPIRKYLGLNFE